MKLKILFALLLVSVLISCSDKKNNTTEESAKTDSVDVSVHSDDYEEPSEDNEDLKKRSAEDSIAYASLGAYNGEYQLHTESDGVDAKLQLMYGNDRTFKYQWSFVVTSEEANCKAELKGTVTMDRTQHGFDSQGECRVHFNFKSLQNGRYAVEINFEDESKCKMVSGPCIFSGTYLKN